MYAMLSNLLEDKKGELTFTCFGAWHLCYILALAILLFGVIFYLKSKNESTRQKAIRLSIHCAFAVYIADFFLMPFAYGEIDVEKLPFHICTAMCVMCFLSRHNSFFEKFRLQFAVLGLISNLVYFIYPAGVMWYQIHPLSYRVIQTLLFHGLMTVYGLLVVIYDDVDFEWKSCYKDVIVLVLMTLWALLGNALYTGTAHGQTYYFNWFFVLRDPFYMFPEHIARFIMPPLNIAVFFAADLLVYAIAKSNSRCCKKNYDK
nr:YwaF family protein [Lachnospiraceae bacterium]